MMDSNGGTGMIMPVAPTGGTGFGNGFGGDGAWWLLILFVLLGGWNNNGYGAGAGGYGANGLYPWMNQSNQINDGFRESQTAQNAFISQGFANEVDQLYNRLNNCPVPTTPVYGRTPIFTCNNQNPGCGCGCGNFA